MGVRGQRHAPAALYPGERAPGTHWIGDWVGPRAVLDAGARGKILCPCRGSNPDRPARSQTIYCLSYSSVRWKVKLGNSCHNSDMTEVVSVTNSGRIRVLSLLTYWTKEMLHAFLSYNVTSFSPFLVSLLGDCNSL
jgi:hypothetical protein